MWHQKTKFALVFLLVLVFTLFTVQALKPIDKEAINEFVFVNFTEDSETSINKTGIIQQQTVGNNSVLLSDVNKFRMVNFNFSVKGNSDEYDFFFYVDGVLNVSQRVQNNTNFRIPVILYPCYPGTKQQERICPHNELWDIKRDWNVKVVGKDSFVVGLNQSVTVLK